MQVWWKVSIEKSYGWWKKSGDHQLIWQTSHYLQGFIHARYRISSINSMGSGSGEKIGETLQGMWYAWVKYKLGISKQRTFPQDHSQNLFEVTFPCHVLKSRRDSPKMPAKHMWNIIHPNESFDLSMEMAVLWIKALTLAVVKPKYSPSLTVVGTCWHILFQVRHIPTTQGHFWKLPWSCSKDHPWPPPKHKHNLAVFAGEWNPELKGNHL